MSLQISLLKILVAHGGLVDARKAHASDPTPETAAALEEALRFRNEGCKEAASQIK
jgi:hypothetical protein